MDKNKNRTLLRDALEADRCNNSTMTRRSAVTRILSASAHLDALKLDPDEAVATHITSTETSGTFIIVDNKSFACIEYENADGDCEVSSRCLPTASVTEIELLRSKINIDQFGDVIGYFDARIHFAHGQTIDLLVGESSGSEMNRTLVKLIEVTRS